ncbi:MAG: hypothetical protein K8J08_06240 [Thermoanaerobaculia bacterium]|nr:hypothetical protein [Thermoanaerobaculia bacterium]
MTNTSKIALTTVATLGFVLSGCAKAPQEEILKSESALESARGADAEEWAGEEWQQAVNAKAALDEELATQSGKMGIMRRYDRTNELVTEANTAAAAAREAALTNKETARAEAAASIEVVQEVLATGDDLVEQLTACPKKPKGFEADMVIITGNLTALRGEFTKVQSLFEAGSYSASIEEGHALVEQIETLTADLEGAMEKIGCEPTQVSTI